MKLSRLIEKHQNSSPPLTLKENLGDGYLIQNNPLFHVIRKKVHQLGFQFTLNVNKSYLALPLSQLETLLQTKTIPYIDNVSILTELKDLATWDDVTDNLKTNNVFHESCHAVARGISTSLGLKVQNAETAVIRLLIEESFANACELLAIVDVDDPVHRIFYEANSYIFMYEDRIQLKKMLSLLGYPNSIQFMMFCYLFSNFLHERITDRDIERILIVIGLQKMSASDLRVLRSCSKVAFELNPRFRWVTTVFYLKLNGFNYTSAQLNQIDFLNRIESEQALSFLIRTLAEVDKNLKT